MFTVNAPIDGQVTRRHATYDEFVARSNVKKALCVGCVPRELEMRSYSVEITQIGISYKAAKEAGYTDWHLLVGSIHDAQNVAQYLKGT